MTWWYRHLDADKDFSPLSNPMAWVEVLMIVIFNFVYWPACVVAFSRGHMYEGVLMFWAFFCSIFYHVGDLAHAQLLGMTPQQWHEIDNVFQISSVNAISFFLLLKNPKHKFAEFSRWMMISLVIIIQQMDHWHPFTTIFPIALPIAVCLFKLSRTAPSKRPIFNEKLTV